MFLGGVPTRALRRSTPRFLADSPDRAAFASSLLGPSDLALGGRSLQQESDSTYWGARRGFARASFWWTMSSFAVWVTNELNPNKIPRITQTSPRIWWSNIEAGFQWDDNTFMYNQIAHPYHGAAFYNSFRNHGFPFWAGGLRFWESAVFYTFLGSLAWECCGESQLMSTNDLITTTMGGAALGEITYRTSSWILDDTATGFDRLWRELTAGILNPPRLFDRLLTRHLTPINVTRGPKLDEEQPTQSDLIAAVGWRSQGKEEDRQKGVFLEMGWRWGNLLALDDTIKHKPFALFSVASEINLGGQGPLVGRAQIEGSLYFWDVDGPAATDGDTPSVQPEDTSQEPSVHKLLVVHNLDYFHNQAFRFGAQSVGLSLFSSFQRGGFLWRSQLGGDMAVLAAVESEEAHRAGIVGYQEREREYDFTMGPGVRGKLGVALVRDQGAHRRLLDLSYQYHRLFTLSGSNDDYWDSWHDVHALGARLKLLPSPLGAWGLDFDFFGFWRTSHYTNPAIQRPLVGEFTPQFRIMLTWEERGLPPPADTSADQPGRIYLPPSL